MKVCIAEKPSVAREIATVLGAKTKKDGYFEGNGYQVTWTFGHFCQLREPEDYRPEWKRWTLHELPMVPERFGIKLIQNKGVSQQFNVIKKLLETAEEVINCGDAGQEGEVIQRWVLTEAKYAKPFKRLWISSLTEEAIRQGFAKLKEGSEFDLLYQAGKSRAIGDWLLGINATRLFTIKYGQGRQLLSLGRVQTPTLAMIVNRWHEIRNFKPEPFWELKTRYRETNFSYVKGKFQQEDKAMAILEAIKTAPLQITNVETKKGIESPPRLFDLTSLQIECNNKLGLSADETLKTVQSLYEKKAVTYPRVDTTFLPDDMYPKISGVLEGLPAQYQQLAAPLLQTKIRKSAKVFNNNKVTDHHAIIPTGASANNFYGAEGNVFDIITKRFLAAFYLDCQVSNTTVEAEVATHPFRVKGKQILEPGWRVVYDKEDQKKEQTAEKEGEEELAILPAFVQGESGPHEPWLDKKMTSPPKDFTEATLLRAMETAGKQVEDDELKEALKENGIGRPSTRAAIIETLYKRQYIKKDKKKIIPTQIGIDLIGVIQNPTLTSVELTGQWEKKLRQIESGVFRPEEFMAELQQLVQEMVTEVKYDNRNLRIEAPAETSTKYAAKTETKNATEKAEKTAKPKAEKAAANGELGNCPACAEGKILKGKSAFGCSRWKDGCKFRLPMDFQGKAFNDKQIAAILKNKKPVLKGLQDANGQKFDAVLFLDEKFELQLEKVEAVPKVDPFEKCPVCKQGKVLKGNTAYGCSRFREGCNLRLPFELAGKTLSDKQIAELLLKRKTGKIKGFVSPKTGNKVDDQLVLNDEGKVTFLL